jgi:hypothetical protein
MMDIALLVREAIRDHTMDAARSQQSAARLIGPSEVGGCRAYLARVIADVPFDEMDDIKFAAFIGTAVGDRLEHAIAATVPGARTQVPVQTRLDSGLMVAGTADVVLPDQVWDFKTVDGLEAIRRTGPSFKQRVQITIYLLGLIQAGELPPDATWALVYIDRSGKDDIPVVYEGGIDDDIMAAIDQRLEDVIYAVQYDLNSAPRDEPFDWCMKVCPFFYSCRGADQHLVSGLIEDEDTLTAIKLYEQGKAEEKVGKQLADEAKEMLRGRSGSTGTVELSWTTVPATEIAAYTRAAYDRITLKPVKKPAVRKSRAKAAAE